MFTVGLLKQQDLLDQERIVYLQCSRPHKASKPMCWLPIKWRLAGASSGLSLPVVLAVDLYLNLVCSYDVYLGSINDLCVFCFSADTATG